MNSEREDLTNASYSSTRSKRINYFVSVIEALRMSTGSIAISSAYRRRLPIYMQSLHIFWMIPYC